MNHATQGKEQAEEVRRWEVQVRTAKKVDVEIQPEGGEEVGTKEENQQEGLAQEVESPPPLMAWELPEEDQQRLLEKRRVVEEAKQTASQMRREASQIVSDSIDDWMSLVVELSQKYYQEYEQEHKANELLNEIEEKES